MVQQSRQPLATCNLNKEKDLNRSPIDCYAPNWPLDGSHSQNMAELPENRPIIRATFPR